VPKAQLQQESDASFRDRVRLVKTKARKNFSSKKTKKTHKNAKTPKKERKGRRKS
jgi:hypothetical protein